MPLSNCPHASAQPSNEKGDYRVNSDSKQQEEMYSDAMGSALLRFALIAFVLFACLYVSAPFLPIMLWALVLAVALYPLQARIERWVGGTPGRGATVLVLGGLLLIGVPTVMLGTSFAEHIFSAVNAFTGDSITIPQPPAGVAEWPLIGSKLYEAWQSAAADLPAFLQTIKPQLANMTKWLLGVAASTAGGVFLLLGALIVAGIMLAYAAPGSRAMGRIFDRLAGKARGPRLLALTTATVRSVATGVLGVAFIQALILGVIFMFAGVPAAGVLAMVTLMLGILQLPALLISLPVIAYLWMGTDASVLHNSIFTILLVVGGFADNVLKPLLLGRGVDAPMPVILLGALGGMVSGGILGMFIGAAFLATGYQVFMEWVEEQGQEVPDGPQPASTA